MIRFTPLLLAGILSIPSTVAAQSSDDFDSKGYFGIGALSWTYDEDNAPEASGTGVQFRLGGEAAEHLDIEARFATGGSDTVTVNTAFGPADVDVELDQALSLFLKPHTGGQQVRGYALLGFTTGELTASAGNFSQSADDSGLSYGLGGEVRLGEGPVWLNVEYVNYLSEDDYTVDGVSAGLRFTF